MTIFTKLYNSKFVKKIFLTSGGIGISIVLSFLLQPIITRLYSPETLGEFSLIVSVVAILNIISSFSYDKAILAAEDYKEATNLFFISSFILLINTVLLFIVFYYGFDLIFENTKYNLISSFCFLIPLFVLLKGFNKNLQYLLIKKGSFTKNSIAEVIKGTLPSTLKIILGNLLSPKIIYLIISTLVGAFINTIFLFSQLFKSILDTLDFSYDVNKKIVIKYIEYFKYFNWNNLLNSFAQQIIFFLLLAFYSTKEVGFYSLAYSVILLPLGLISGSVYKVFLPHLSKTIKKNKKIGSNFKKVTLYLLAIGFFGFLILFFIAPWLFQFVFGEEWRESGLYARCLIPWILMLFINKPANSIIQAFQKFKFLTIYNITVLILRILSVALGYYLYDSVIVSLILFSLVGFLSNLIFISYSYKFVVIYDKKIEMLNHLEN